jgi:hypothetical protein
VAAFERAAALTPDPAHLLLGGLVTHEVTLGGWCSANLLGPGDVFRPWLCAYTPLPCDERWTAAGGAAIAVLDERFVMIARRWPGLSAVVHERLAEQLEVAAVRGAIAGLPRVEQRVLALLWQLADRWGVVRPDGIAIELSLTHALIGAISWGLRARRSRWRSTRWARRGW